MVLKNSPTTRQPGYTNSGNGVYAQSIDTADLSEGMHFVTVRAFRHRDASTGGDGGPAVFTDFKRAIYVDRFAPESTILSFEPYASSPTTLQNRDLIVKSDDGTANAMHMFLDLPAGLTDAQVLQMATNGQNSAGRADTDVFAYGFTNVGTGNHTATVVTFEPSFDGVHGFTIQRVVGMYTATGVGAGFGDLNYNGQIRTSDLVGLGNGSFEDVLYSQDTKFNAAADLDGNGRVDNLDLFALGPVLEANGISPTVMSSFNGVLLRRGDINQDAVTDVGDVSALYAAFGTNSWFDDLNVDGQVDAGDIQSLITNVFRTVNGDFDLDGDVDGRDFLTWQRNAGTLVGAHYDQGDADLNGIVDGNDLAIWQAAYGGVNPATSSVAVKVPEPQSVMLLILAGIMGQGVRRRRKPA